MCFPFFGGGKNKDKNEDPANKSQAKTAGGKANTTKNITEKTEDSKKTDAVNDEVAAAMIDFVEQTVNKGIEGLEKEFNQLAPLKPMSSTRFNAEENKKKNRYNNIPCYDHSRIVLKYNVPPDTDYIHANLATSKLAPLKLRFICTQAPVLDSINDFWRLVWQEKPKYIVMLCKLIENKKPKCSEYWPMSPGETKEYGTVTVTNEGEIKQDEQVFEMDKFRVTVQGQPEILVKHVRWLDWPDFGIPASGLGMLRILRKIEQEKGTAIIHCSAGIGRSGTIMAAEIIMQSITNGTKIKAIKVVEELRSHRYGLVQTQSQYIYLHLAICTYLERKIPKNNPKAPELLQQLKQFFADYREYATKEEAADRKLADKGLNTRNETNVKTGVKHKRGTTA